MHAYRQRNAALPAIVAAFPLLLSAACLIGPDRPAWQVMWILAIGIYASLKWLTFANSGCERAPRWSATLGYLLLWPGMDARGFLEPTQISLCASIVEWLAATFKTLLGALFILIAGLTTDGDRLLVGWLAMVGFILAFHCGLFHLIALVWRTLGRDVQPIMNAPLLATSLADFWGRRWNRAFRDLALRQCFLPLARRWGAVASTMFVFVGSGLLHELVITFPVHGGWGGPTLYFTLQGMGLLVERSVVGSRLARGSRLWGRGYCALFVAGPLGFLFPVPFVEQAILPTVDSLVQPILKGVSP